MRDIRLILGDNEYTPWVPNSSSPEADLRDAVLNYSSRILGENFHVFPLEERISSLAAVTTVPDAVALNFKEKVWGLVEFELESHSEYSHIVSQLSKFLSAISRLEGRRPIVESLYAQITAKNELCKQFRAESETADIHKALDLIYDVEPFILVAVDYVTPRLIEALGSLQGDIRVAEIRLFVPIDNPSPAR